jgi:peptidoglycan/LPS O-acetylase OafA/YrhL
LYNGRYGVTFFFLVSAFCLYRNSSDKIINKQNYFGYIFNRTCSFYPIYIVSMLIFGICQIFSGDNIIRIILYFFFSATLTQALSVKYWSILNSAGWYLSALFVLYIISPVLIKLTNTLSKKLAKIFVFLLILLIPIMDHVIRLIASENLVSM